MPINAMRSSMFMAAMASARAGRGPAGLSSAAAALAVPRFELGSAATASGTLGVLCLSGFVPLRRTRRAQLTTAGMLVSYATLGCKKCAESVYARCGQLHRFF